MDSTSVLKYIKIDTSRFHPFFFEHEHYKHHSEGIETLEIILDIVSRGLKEHGFVRNKTRLSGLAYLLHPEHVWPVIPDHLGS